MSRQPPCVGQERGREEPVKGMLGQNITECIPLSLFHCFKADQDTFGAKVGYKITK